MWLLKYDLRKRTAHNGKKTLTVKCILPLEKWLNYFAVFVMIKKQTKSLFFFWLFQNYEYITHVQKHKTLNLSFKTFFIHILAN